MAVILSDQSFSTIRWLLQELNDPFAVFPLQDVARSLGESIADSEEAFREREGSGGVARKYWDVPMEMLDHGIGVAIGATFVLGQAAITQAVSMVAQIRKLVGDDTCEIPKGKIALLEFKATAVLKNNLNSIIIIDTAANYFKHYHEWPKDWHHFQGSAAQSSTMKNAKCIGLQGHDLNINMGVVLKALELNTSDVFKVPMIVHAWRKRVAVYLCRKIGLPLEIID
ncbi:MAG: hypothetical protein Q4G39_04355 [Brachymonas sp.]|nr:hypothetical protein [Brachymonas sp.]